MEEKVNYTLVGAFVVILSIALVTIGYWLTSARQSKDYDRYVVYMKEPVSGLNVMAPVKYNGVVVGYVNSIRLDRDNPQLVRVVLEIERGTPITESTVATLLPQGITGITYIGLKTTSAIAELVIPEPGEPYPIIPSEPSFLVYFSDSMQSITKNLNKLSESFQNLLSEQSTNDLKASFSHLNKITKTLSDNSKQIDESLKSSSRMLNNISRASEDLPEVMHDIKDTLKTLRGMAAKLKDAGNKVGLTMKDSQVVVQNLAQQAMPAAVRTIEHLEHVSSNLQQLTAEMQRNPSIILRGKQASLPGPGER